MPRQIVIHAGFHKTGTSSVQQTLRANRPLLKPYLRSILKGEMTSLIHAARGYSTWRDPITLDKFATRFRALLTGLPGMPRRTLCLSAEELSGHMPGRENLPDYSAAPILAATMANAVADIFPDTKLVFFYSTRDPDTWLRSAYWQHVRTSSLTLEYGEFAQTHPAAANLDQVVEQVKRAQPYPVHHTRLEASAGLPAGPATPLLDLCNVPTSVQADLSMIPPANERRDSATLLALLAANRDYTDRDARKIAKQAILNRPQESTGD